MSGALVAEVGTASGLTVESWRDLGGGFTTNLALRTVVAHALLPLSGGRHVEVEPYVEAREPMKTPPRLLAGYAVLARLHDVLAAAALPPAADLVRWSNHVPAQDAVAVTRAATSALLRDPGAEFEGFTEELLAHVRSVAALEDDLAGCSPVQLTHGDFWDGNVLFDGEEVAAVLHLGFMALRPRVDDLALPFWFWLLEPGRGLPTADDVELLALLADAYDDGARTPLSPQERAALPLAVARQPAWSAHHWVADSRPGAAAELARKAAGELPVARAVLDQLPVWRRALTTARRRCDAGLVVTPATLTRRALPPPHDPRGSWLLRVELVEGRVLVVEWTTARDATPGADEVDDALDGSGWVLAGPLLEVAPGTWSVDLVADVSSDPLAD